MKKFITIGFLIASTLSYSSEVCIVSGKLDSSSKPTVQCSDSYITAELLNDAGQVKLFGDNVARALNCIIDKKSYVLQSTVVTPDGTLTYTLIRK